MGVTSFKVYMAYRSTVGLGEEDLTRVMKAVGKAGALVAIHCEEGDEIEKLRTKYFNEGNTSPLYHALSRPAYLESAAVRKAIEIAGKASCPLYIVHVSSRKSLEHISDARAKGQKVYAETCPQYLLLDDSKYTGTFEQTAPFVISPPLRTPEDNRALWHALADGTISTIGTDHCPFTMAQKLNGINDFRVIPGGAGGVEHRKALLCTYGALTRRLSINQIVNIISAAPSEIFGLSPRKGKIVTGSDADLVIWNPSTENVISAKTHHQNCDINIYDGMKVKGNAEYVIRRGEIIIENGLMKGSNKPGEFLFRPLNNHR
jgi:dihydropyrimidinase